LETRTVGRWRPVLLTIPRRPDKGNSGPSPPLLPPPPPPARDLDYLHAAAGAGGAVASMAGRRLHAKRATPSGRCRRSSAGPGRIQQLWTLPSQTVRGFFCVCANILSVQVGRCQDFVGAEFCRRGNFVDAGISLTPIISVGANILLPPIFCRRQYFVTANILSVFRIRGDFYYL
jgi:hypothetical protein